MNGETEVKSMYIKKSDVTNGNLEQVLYDPGVLTEDNKHFMGWTDDENYGSDTSGKTIAQIRNEVTDLLNEGVADGQTQTYYAMMLTAYNLFYESEEGIVFKTDSLTGTGNALSTSVNATYTVSEAGQGLIGWAVKGVGTDRPDYHVYKNGESITITDDTVLVPVIGEGHWLHFDENDGGAGVGNASYTPPAFIAQNETCAAAEPAEPTRPGYTFAGWYTSATGGEPFDFSNEINADTTIYAHWTPKAEAEYKVIIWTQKVTDDKNAADADKTYDYLESHTFTVPTDTPITESTISQYLNYGNTELGVTDLEHGSYGFNKPARWEIKNGTGANENGVSADGNTVVNVYYDRALMTIIFDNPTVVTVNEDGTTTNVPKSEIYIPAESGATDVYGLINGEYVPLDAEVEKKIVWYSNYNNAQSGSNYSIIKSLNTIYYKLDNDSIWHAVSTSNIDLTNAATGTAYQYYNPNNSTLTNTSNSVTGRPMCRTDSSSKSVYARVVAGNATYSYNGQVYTGTVYKKENIIAYTGLYGQSFSQYSYEWPVPDSSHHWKYISYLDAFTGNVFGDSNVGSTPNQIHLVKSEETSNITIVFWTQDANDSNVYTAVDSATYTCGQNDGYNITDRIQGMISSGYRWSTSASQPGIWNSAGRMDSATDGINSNGFTNIKRGNNSYLHIRYDRVKNDIVFMVGDDEITDARISDVPYGKSLSGYEDSVPETIDPSLIPPGYYFAGWYADPEFNTAVDWENEMMPLGNKVLYAKIAPEEYHVKVYLNGGTISENQATNFWVPYETVLDDTYFNQATYTADEHHSLVGWFTDEACTQPWNFTTKLTRDSLAVEYTGPNDEARVEYGDNGHDKTVGVFKLYAKWRDDSIAESGGLRIRYENPAEAPEYSYEDPLHYADQAYVTAAAAPPEDKWPEGKEFAGWQLSEETYAPTDTFVADSTLAADETIEEGGETKTIKVITLTAVYKEKETHTPTHINWYKNDGSGGTYREDEDLSINEAVYVYGYDPETHTVTPPTREGYVFRGWAKDSEYADADETQARTSTTKTDLFITYDADTNKYDITRVAADEVRPYEALYAVWERQTQKIKVYKYDTTDETKALQNAEFSLTGPDGSNIKLSGLMTNEEGYLEFGEEIIDLEVPMGEYTLTEDHSPAGYNIINKDSIFTVTSSGVIGIGDGYYTIKEVSAGEETGVYIIKVANLPGVELPHTGGMGTTLFYIFGALLVLVCGAMLIARRRCRA